MARLQVKNIREEAAASDGLRVLVDRLWPRGVSKADAALDAWPKDVAPSTELRRWFHDESARSDFATFSSRYRDELDGNDAVSHLQSRCRDAGSGATVTLLTATSDPEHNHAQVLLAWLREHRSRY